MSHRSDEEPHETLQLAVSSLRLVGGILLLIASIGLAVSTIARAFGGGGPWEADLYRAALYVSPGSAELVFAHFLAHRQRWAAIAGTVITAVIAILSAIVTYSLMVALMDEANWMIGMPLIFCLVFTVAAGMLAYRLPTTLDAIARLEPATRRPAFEPVMVEPSVLPPPPLAGEIDVRRAAD